MEWLDLGPVPAEESCEQLGRNYNPDRARLECQTYKAQLIRQFGEPPEGYRIRIKSNPHDFGNYLSVEVGFEEDNEAAAEYAFKVEAETPSNWDEESRKALSL